MRRAIGAVLIATAFIVSPAVASAAPIKVPAVQGRVLYDFNTVDDKTTMRQLVVVGAAVGTPVLFAYACRKCPIKIADRTVTVGPDGVVDLTSDGAMRFTAGDRFAVTVSDAQGRWRRASYAVRRKLAPRLTRTCGQPDTATSTSTSIPCEVTCDLTTAYPEGDPCVAAGKTVTVPEGKTSWAFHSDRRGTRLTQLSLASVPEGATVLLICRGPDPRGRDCPFFLRALRPVSGAVDVRPSLSGKRFPSGVELLVWLVRGNERGGVLRLAFKARQRPQAERLCMPLTSLKPVRCDLPLDALGI